MPCSSTSNQSPTLIPAGRMHLKAQTGHTTPYNHPTVYGTQVPHKSSPNQALCFSLALSSFSMPLWLEALTPYSMLALSSACEWKYLQSTPLHPSGQFWFHTDQRTSLPILCAPSCSPYWVLTLAASHWHSQNHSCFSWVEVLLEGRGWGLFTCASPVARKASDVLTGIWKLAELKWKVVNPLTVFYFHNKGEPVYLTQVDLLWNTS